MAERHAEISTPVLTVRVDLIGIKTSRLDCWSGLMLGEAVRFYKEASTAPCSLFVYPGSHKILPTCLLIGLSCRTPWLIDWGARWLAEPVVLSSCSVRSLETEVQAVKQGGGCIVYMPAQQTHMEVGSRWLGIIAQVALVHTYYTWHRIRELTLLTVTSLLPCPVSPPAVLWGCKVCNCLILISKLIWL